VGGSISGAGHIQFKAWGVAKNYLKSWFVVDVLSTVRRIATAELAAVA
jgi:hypothetical protein